MYLICTVSILDPYSTWKYEGVNHLFCFFSFKFFGPYFNMRLGSQLRAITELRCRLDYFCDAFCRFSMIFKRDYCSFMCATKPHHEREGKSSKKRKPGLPHHISWVGSTNSVFFHANPLSSRNLLKKTISQTWVLGRRGLVARLESTEEEEKGILGWTVYTQFIQSAENGWILWPSRNTKGILLPFSCALGIGHLA